MPRPDIPANEVSTWKPLIIQRPSRFSNAKCMVAVPFLNWAFAIYDAETELPEPVMYDMFASPVAPS
jgi:hypothetical protein